MKRLYIMWTLASLLLAACAGSGEDFITPAQEPMEDVTACFDSEGNAYLRLGINTGGLSTTRATGSSFDHGTSEYEIDYSKSFLLLFSGSSESDAKLISTYPLAKGTTATQPSSQVSYTDNKTLKISREGLESGKKLFAYVLLNSQDYTKFTFGRAFSSEDFLEKQTEAGKLSYTDGGKTYYLMSNAPVTRYRDDTSADDRTVEPTYGHTTLVQITSAQLFTTEEQAGQFPALQINVERAAAKVTVAGPTADGTIMGNPAIKYAKADVSWCLTRQEKNTYLTRHVDDSWLSITTPRKDDDVTAKWYRFAEKDPVTNVIVSQVYRTNWAESVGYGAAALEETTAWDSKETYYIPENTMPADKMTQDRTTALLVRLQLNNGEDFYTLPELTGSDVIYKSAPDKLTEDGTTPEHSLAPTRSNTATEATGIEVFLRQWLLEESSELRQFVKDDCKGNNQYIRITVTPNAEKGTATAKIEQKAIATDPSVIQDMQEKLDALTINYYKEGYCYYRGLIKHFGDYYTPWDVKGTATGYDDIYPATDRTARYLGRYGIVRNHWYKLTIGDFLHVGTSVIPPVTYTDGTTPLHDDASEELLNMKLGVLSWYTP